MPLMQPAFRPAMALAQPSQLQVQQQFAASMMRPAMGIAAPGMYSSFQLNY